MEKLSIQDASRRLNISQRDVREYIRNGELKAERDPDSEHGRWLVLMPEGDWQDKFKSYLDELDASITRWWWTNVSKTGSVHYLENTGIETSSRTISADIARRTSGPRWATPPTTDASNASCGPRNAACRCSKRKSQAVSGD